MSVNMFRCPVRSERQPRTKNGQPAHITTGVVSANCVQRDAAPMTQCGAPGSKCAIASRKTGSVSAAPIHKRRVMSRSSPSSSSALRPSSVPAPCRTSGIRPDDPARSPGASGRCRSSLPRLPRRVAFERHAAFRAIARLVGFHAGTHRAEIFRRGGRPGVAVMVRVSGAAARRLVRRHGRRRRAMAAAFAGRRGIVIHCRSPCVIRRASDSLIPPPGNRNLPSPSRAWAHLLPAHLAEGAVVPLGEIFHELLAARRAIDYARRFQTSNAITARTASPKGQSHVSGSRLRGGGGSFRHRCNR